MYICQIENCNSKFYSLRHYITHKSLHYHSKRIKCVYQHCYKTFTSCYSLESHVARSHKQVRSCVKFYKGQLKCTSKILCNTFTFNSCKTLVSHLKMHLKNNEVVACPFPIKNVCDDKIFKNFNHFGVHISRYHSGLIKESVTHQSIESANINNPQNITNLIKDNSTSDQAVQNSAQNNLNISFIEPNLPIENSLEKVNSEITKKLITFCLELQVKHFISNSVIQKIIEQLTDIAIINTEGFHNSFVSVLKSLNLPCDEVDKLANKASEQGKFFENCLKNDIYTTFKRKKLQKLSGYLEPQEIFLGYNNNKSCSFQYISIIESIKCLLNNKTVKNLLQYSRTQNKHFTDFFDGSLFKKRQFFIDHPEALQIILFQDEFQIVNPLGTATHKNKMLGVYFNLGNLPLEKRMSVDSIQLVMLGKASYLKHFGAENVFSHLIKDLKKLENGIEFNNYVLYGTVVFIAGDNLGSNLLCGISTCFSSNYYCRFCTSSKDSILQSVTGDGACRNVNDSLIGEKGYNLECCFDSLCFFKAMLPGFPPCLAHDVFEGWVQYDLNVILHYFINIKKYFTLSFLNDKLSSFKYGLLDSSNRPHQINSISSNSKLKGSATETWCFLRFLPFLINDKVLKNDPMYEMLVLMHQCVQIIVAPKFAEFHSIKLKYLFNDYMLLRFEHFSTDATIKPKHHFVSHYANLMLLFGPLKYVWTLHFEQKHGFFKSVVHNSCNFINIAHTLAERHQLLTTYNNIIDIYQMELTILKVADINELSSACISFLQHHNSDDIFQKVKYEGIIYAIGMVVVMKCEADIPIFGKIEGIIKNEWKLSFILNEMHTIIDEHLCFFYVKESNKLSISALSTLIDYYPLSVYKYKDKNIVILKHLVFDYNE